MQIVSRMKCLLTCTCSCWKRQNRCFRELIRQGTRQFAQSNIKSLLRESMGILSEESFWSWHLMMLQKFPHFSLYKCKRGKSKDGEIYCFYIILKTFSATEGLKMRHKQQISSHWDFKNRTSKHTLVSNTPVQL